MFRSLSAVTLLALSALAVFPATAGERRLDHRFPDHRFSGHRHAVHNGLFLGERAGWRNRGIRFDHAFGHRYVRERMPFLKQYSSPATNRVARGALVIIAPQAPRGDSGGTYAGSSYAYQVDGGTYVGGYGYGYYPAARPEPQAPKAKVIDVAIQDDPCTYEANVCVIRP
ncbi:hypothetical protein RLEG12_29900 [Rhizobium leguminosarum bv. trifolii CB782]|uniref:hypothetical protein n=1 Tax=Rhizobium hidalgonense TaxID=1538159 RepID=UPI00027D316B|nr:hypothetical protein [Rhizobium hidalgonense]AHG47211.1 hypothetical protein RLEG12_29900 [Rhizobium leguminosarum bv. trifolii CB782]EJC76111.1 hypothetical protein Rleg10DRAFT_4756 [Rhizobium leguminosarum bv. trifolii WSM2012]MDR9806578.1 hypothetical protein [Rhizobium hidalgonense]QKK22075.1 hypothetical protein FFM81_001250 [Rhizobium hidalgonense]